MYKSGHTLKLYQILENDLANFLHYIPIDYYLDDQWKKIYSPRLAELLIRIGSQVDIFFRYWDIVHAVYKSKNPNKKFNIDDLNFGHYKDIEIDGKIVLSNEEINILSSDEDIKPFEFWADRRYPLWWTSYNNVKHQGFTYKREGDLYNVIESLAALFLINCIHEDTLIKLEEYGYIHISEPRYLYMKSQLFGYEKIERGVSLFEF